MTTALDIVTDAFEKIGVYAPGEVVSNADAERCLTVLNDMLDSWSAESLACFAILEQSVALTPFQQSYTVGSGGSINGTRPIRVNDEPGSAYIQDVNGNNYPLSVVPRDQWNAIGNRGNAVTSNIPDTLFYDPQFPLGILNFYPMPNVGGYTAYWDSYLQLTQFSSLTGSGGTFSFPPGYLLALKSNLAVMVFPYFSAQGAQLSPNIEKQAMVAKGVIKRSNLRPLVATLDKEIVGRGGGTYNIYTGA